MFARDNSPIISKQKSPPYWKNNQNIFSPIAQIELVSYDSPSHLLESLDFKIILIEVTGLIKEKFILSYTYNDKMTLDFWNKQKNNLNS